MLGSGVLVRKRQKIMVCNSSFLISLTPYGGVCYYVIKHMKNSKQLLNNIIGQLNGISKMMDNKKDCKDVITQLKAIKSATSTLMNRYIEENALSCLKKKSVIKTVDKEEIKSLLKELINNN